MTENAHPEFERPHSVEQRAAGYIESGQLQLAQQVCDRHAMPPDPSVIASVVGLLALRADTLRAAGEIRAYRRLKTRLRALAIFRCHGFEPGRLIPVIVLPEGYQGKILLVSVSDDGFQPLVCLRSGDIWHREILQDAREEIIDAGFHDAVVDPLGGARVRLNRQADIIVCGGSDEFGACDKHLAAQLIQDAFPRKCVIVEH